MAMEYHPDKNQDQNSFTDSIFKKVKKAYDVLSDPRLKKKYDEKEILNDKYNAFVEKNKNIVFEAATEDAFSQLIKGKYPDTKTKREMKAERKSEVDVSNSTLLLWQPSRPSQEKYWNEIKLLIKDPKLFLV